MDSLCVAALLLALCSPVSAFAPTAISRGNPRSIDHVQLHDQLSHASSATRHSSSSSSRCDLVVSIVITAVTTEQRRGGCITGCTLRLLLLGMHVAPDHFGVSFLVATDCTRESSAQTERRRGVGDRGRELVLEATAVDRMDRADFVRVAAGAASTLVATSLAKESLAADVSGACVATIAVSSTSQRSTGLSVQSLEL